MESIQATINEYRKQMAKGDIPKTYQGLMQYIMDLRTHFKNNYPDAFISGSIYYGFMDMTYFSFIPATLKQRKLKIAVVFIHDTCRFEVWLAGFNKQVQSKYWKLFKESDWNLYHLVATTKGVDSIIETVVAGHPDFSDLTTLTSQIESATLKFTTDIENFLSQHKG
jgi:hypothetical protein